MMVVLVLVDAEVVVMVMWVVVVYTVGDSREGDVGVCVQTAFIKHRNLANVQCNLHAGQHAHYAGGLGGRGGNADAHLALCRAAVATAPPAVRPHKVHPSVCPMRLGTTPVPEEAPIAGVVSTCRQC